MHSPPFAGTLLWLFVINLGVAFGAGLYEHRIVVPRWLVYSEDGPHWNAQAAQNDNTGLRFWAYVTTGPLTLLALANLYSALNASEALRGWWLAATAAVLVDRVLTFAHFIPTMVGLMNAGDSSTSVAVATRWVQLNYLRHALLFCGWIGSLRVFSLLY